MQTLSKAFDMSINTPLALTVALLSKAVCISCIIECSWAIHESPGKKPDCEEVKRVVTLKVIGRIINYSFKNFTNDGK